ncbi:nucleotide disphospho-sugar-binding domain-containing protein [Streptomyces sp. NPDC005648]|uniref:glycosyltransferase n=1 Tax=Streptomyces sp. NPDC005648 TaxID=3157044 RepID=UPI0033B771AE
MTLVIATATPFHGHVQPVLTVASDLVRRGHEVVVLTGSRFAEDVRAAGAQHVSLPPDADFDDRRLELYFPERAALPVGPRQLDYDLKHVFGDPTAAQYRALRGLLARRFPASVVIGDPLFLGATALALSAPPGRRPVTVSLGITMPTLLSEDAPPIGLGMPPLVGEGAKKRHREMNDQVRDVFADAQRHVEDNFGESGTELPGFLLDCLVTVPDHYLQLTVPGFEYPRGDLPPSFRFVGPLPAAPGRSRALPEWWAEVTDSDRPVVVVTQGSFDNRDLGRLVRPALDALAGEDVLVVAATGRADGPDELRATGPVPANARIGGYVPFDALLPHASVLVTNGGYGGVHQALGHGVPLVVGGDGEDKPEVAARVEWSGTGVDLRTGNPSPRAVRSAVRRVLTEPGFRRRAADLREEFRRHDALEAIAEVVETAGASGAAGASTALGGSE